MRRAATADVRASQRLAAAIADLSIDDNARLDDQLRAAILATLERLIDAIEGNLRHYAGRAVATSGVAVVPLTGRLVRAGLFDDDELVAELVSRAMSEIIASRLPTSPSDQPDRPSLLPRLANDTDRVIANAAAALMAAEARRRGPGPDAGRDDLPAELHHRLVWWIAAGLRPTEAITTVDTPLVDAARRVLAGHDEGARVEAVAQRLAAALDPDPSAIGGLIDEALADRRLSLVVALIAHGLAIDPALVREMILDPDGDRLVLALRALSVPREIVVQIVLALGDADHRRDAEALIAAIDAAAGMSIEVARDVMARLRLPADYRQAARALDRRQ